MERQRLTVKGLKDMLGFELEQVTKRILDAQNHAETRLQVEVGALRGEMSTLRADVNRRFDIVGTRFDELKAEIGGLKGDISEIKGLIKNNHAR